MRVSSSFSALRDRSWSFLTLVLATSFIFLVVLFALRFWSQENNEAEASEEQASLVLIANLESSIRSYVARLQGASAFVSADDPTLEEFRWFVEQSGFGEESTEFSGVAVVEVVEGQSGLAELSATELQDGNEAFEFQAVNTEVDRHYVFTRESRSNAPIQFIGVDLALNADIAAGLEASLDAGQLTSIAVRPDSSEPQAAAILETLRASGSVGDSEILIVGPIARTGSSKLILGRALTVNLANELEEKGFGVNLNVDGVDVELSPSPSGSNSADANHRFSTGEIEWVLSVESPPVAPSRTGSWGMLAAGIIVAAAIAVAARGSREAALKNVRLERSELAARTDFLTGLPNRLGLEEQLANMLRRQDSDSRVGVFFLDLDRLKVINDSIGHGAGDKILQAVGKRLQEATRRADLVGRFAGDEFVVVSGGIADEQGVASVAEKLLAQLREPIEIGEGMFQVVSGSIGVALASPGTNAETILQDADTAMYEAKASGGNGFKVVDDELRQRAIDRLQVERALRKKLDSNSLEVHYHPIVDSGTHRIVGVEALARLFDDKLGEISPGVFIPIAAEAGLIVELGAQVLDTACMVRSGWADHVDHDFKMAVNLAEGQFIGHGLVEAVTGSLERHGLDPSQLELEVSEELLFERDGHRLEVLRELSRTGVHLALDDFGTGRAGLGQLRELSMVKVLKIDRSLVSNLAENSVDIAVLNAVVALAEDLQMAVVAEGVEDAQQAEILHNAGVGFLQGFKFTAPAPAEDVLSTIVGDPDIHKMVNRL